MHVPHDWYINNEIIINTFVLIDIFAIKVAE